LPGVQENDTKWYLKRNVYSLKEKKNGESKVAQTGSNNTDKIESNAWKVLLRVRDQKKIKQKKLRKEEGWPILATGASTATPPTPTGRSSGSFSLQINKIQKTLIGIRPGEEPRTKSRW
jgi:hypothetical protein